VGPYFVDEKLNRWDFTNTTDANVLDGIPLALTLTIMNYTGGGCSKLSGALVDIWQLMLREFIRTKPAKTPAGKPTYADTRSPIQMEW
jgi:hypothetical protein